jgi:hypothetical protein
MTHPARTLRERARAGKWKGRIGKGQTLGNAGAQHEDFAEREKLL